MIHISTSIDPGTSMPRHLLPASLLIVFLGPGCGVSPVASRLSNPVIEDRVGLFDNGPVGIIATTADRRSIMFRDVEPEDRARKGVAVEVCAEPPPDVAANIASELSGELAGSINDIDITKLTASQRVALVSQLLFARSQGIQMYRDGMYNLCIASLNKYVTPEFYMTHSREILASSKELALKEVELRDMTSNLAASVPAPNPFTSSK
jgi:hypothetical protein